MKRKCSMENRLCVPEEVAAKLISEGRMKKNIPEKEHSRHRPGAGKHMP